MKSPKEESADQIDKQNDQTVALNDLIKIKNVRNGWIEFLQNEATKCMKKVLGEKAVFAAFPATFFYSDFIID